MGYTTDFAGQFYLDRELSDEHAAYLRAFSYSRRMKRDALKAAYLPDPVREAAGLPVGDFGGYFVGGGGLCGQGHDASIQDYNSPPPGQPSLWCHWTPSDDNLHIEWDEGEKFYDYVAWLQYIVDHFLQPWGYKLTGSVTWRGECMGDEGVITVVDGVVYTGYGTDAVDPPIVDDLEERLAKRGLTSAALDDVVISAAEGAASDANNSGLSGQIAYLRQQGWSDDAIIHDAVVG